MKKLILLLVLVIIIWFEPLFNGQKTTIITEKREIIGVPRVINAEKLQKTE